MTYFEIFLYYTEIELDASSQTKNDHGCFNVL